MIRQGATTTMEAWTPAEKPNLTWSHPWAASPAVALLRWLFGVRPTSPGFTSIVIQPQPGSLPSGNATVPSIRGPIGVTFSQSFTGVSSAFPTAFTLSVRIPGAVAASLCLPRSACVGGVVGVDGVGVAGVVDGSGHFVCVGVMAGEHVAVCAPAPFANSTAA